MSHSPNREKTSYLSTVLLRAIFVLLAVIGLLFALSACRGPEDDVDGSCNQDCTDRECGPDPRCRESCGTCSSGSTCSWEGICVCEPDCSGRQCGLDPECGESCGTCPSGFSCDWDGTCVDESPCEEGDYECSDSDRLLICEGSRGWVSYDCETECTVAGFVGTNGCRYSSESGHDVCMCFSLGGTGDACTENHECEDGDCASLALWCARSCYSSSSCLGNGAGGRNETNGHFNYCVETYGGYECFPGCTTDSDCLPYGFGDCRSVQTTSGSEMVCANPG